MKRIILTTALVCASTVAAYAQAGDAQGDDCKRLAVLLTQKKIGNSPVTLAQARSYEKDGNNAPCRKVLAANEGAAGAQVSVHQPAAKVQVQQPAADVSVKQAKPEVTVNQGQPTVVVHQPAPTVTVNIPEPTITIRMPEPDVNVAQAKPQVSVSQPQPQVSVVQPNGKAQVTTSDSQADVDVNPSNQAPKIQYSSDKAKVVVKQPNAQPKVNVVHAGDADDVPDTGTNDASQQAMAQPNVQPAAQAGRQVSVSSLLSMDLYNINGNKLGDVEHVVTDAKGGHSVVIGHGGFLGLGEKQIAVPLSDIAMKNGRLVTNDVSDDQIKSMPEYDGSRQKDLDRSQSVTLGAS